MRWRQSPITVAQAERDYTGGARAWLRGAIAGATTIGAATYLFDPDSGRRRRAELRDRGLHTGRRARELLDAAGRDLLHRARGRLAEGVGRFEDHPDDSTLTARVRAHLGHVSSHPRAIAVEARAGRVQLRGHVLAHEAPRVIEGIRGVRGVTQIDNALELHSEAEHVARLQGGERRLEDTRWPPGPRLAAAAAAVGLLAYGARRRSLNAPLATTAGAVLLVRSMTNRPLRLGELDNVLQSAMPAHGGEPAHEGTRVAT
jgi:BON domain-containing protein